MKGVIIITDEIITNLLNISQQEIQESFSYHKNNILYFEVTLKRKECFCPFCGSSTLKIKEYRLRKINHSAFQFQKCVILYHARRFQCTECRKTFYEPCAFTEQGSNTSHLTILNVLHELKETSATFASVARHNSMSPTKVQEIFDTYVDIPRQPLCEVICIDEVYTETSTVSKYSCLILDFLSYRLIDVIHDRKKYTLLNYFESIPKDERKRVRYFIMDMYETYRMVVRMRFPQAKIAVDSFHVLKNYTTVLDQVRLRILRRFNKKDDKYYLLKKFNWLLMIDEPRENEAKYNRRLKRYINYPQLLDLVLSISEELRDAYNLKSDYLYLNRYCTQENIRETLDNHLEKMKNSGISEIIKFRKTLNHWYEEIIVSFTYINGRRLSNGIMESRNGIAKKIKNNANGYYNFARYRNRCLYVMNKDSRPNLSKVKNTVRMKGQKRGKYKKQK